MSHPSKKKGTGFERELVVEASAKGIPAERAWGSNGEALGFHKDVDVVLFKDHSRFIFKIQCKRRNMLSKVLRPPESCNAQVVREDYGESFIIMRWKEFLPLLKSATQETV